MLCFIDFCIALCNCSNARVRYDVTCRYSNVGKHITHITYVRIPASYVVSSSRIRTITLFNAEVNETKHNCGEVQQIMHKVIIPLTILRL